MSIVKIEVKKCLHKMPSAFYTKERFTWDGVSMECTFITYHENKWYKQNLILRPHQTVWKENSAYIEIEAEDAKQYWLQPGSVAS